MDKKPHLIFSGFVNSEKFKSKRLGRSPGIPSRDRVQHGDKLLNQYNQLLQIYLSKRSQAPKSITEEFGIYVEVTSAAKTSFPIEKLDNKDFILCGLKSEGDCEVAVLFIPGKKRSSFVRKIEEYLNPNKDSKKGPRNQALINVIETIKIANLHSFWTDDPNEFPQDNKQEIWLELWLSKRENIQDPILIANSLAQRLNAKVSNASLGFYHDIVILIKTSISKLEEALELIANLSEIRKAKEVPEFILRLNPKEQSEWADNILNQVSLDKNISTTICILDSGINYNNSLLSVACKKERCATWNPDWPKFDNFNPSYGVFNDHGSRQAGLAIYGQLEDLINNKKMVLLKHDVESARILAPESKNEPELYGAITKGTISKLEVARPNQNRIYSLAITASPEYPSGQPSSWSSEIDYYCSGFEDDRQRLFIISAGNNINLNPTADYWDQVHLAPIEDPAQAWNAITVGAYTELSTNNDPQLIGWSPLALPGDISSASTTSVCWGWKKQAPFKPDLVAEGGNRLLSPNRKEITDADTVSLLTTSGRADGGAFETTRDTSAATAIISNQAAQILAEYPTFWPETVRGLLVHSAKWTPRMYERLGSLSTHSDKVAKETMLRIFGYGVPNLERALHSANNKLTLIAQDFIQPFYKSEMESLSLDPKFYEMNLYELPWPKDVLLSLGEMEVNLRIVLSYFIEPNPGRRGYRQRYSYQSHGLRFDVIRPEQELDNFRASLNKIAVSEEYEGPQGNTEGWHLGPQLRTRGSLHSDFWTGTAAELSAMNAIAVYPVSGWWKYRPGQERCNNRVRYSLIASIEVADESVDIYSVVDNIIKAKVSVKV
jgi:hypothetical protein